MRTILVNAAALILCFSACAQEKIPAEKQSVLIFQSGFEPDSKVVSRGSDADIVGIDRSLKSNNDWVADFDSHPDIGNFNLQY